MKSKLVLATIFAVLAFTLTVYAYDWDDCPANKKGEDGNYYGCGTPKPTSEEAKAAGKAQAALACEADCKARGFVGGTVSGCVKIQGHSGGGHQALMKCTKCDCSLLAPPVIGDVSGIFWGIGGLPLS